MSNSDNLARNKKGFLRNILYKILLAVNILFALALLVSYLSVNINPEDFMLPAFFGLAYPYLLLINFIIGVIWAVNLKVEAFISLIVIVLGFTHLSNFIRFGNVKPDTEGSFKVLSYNVRLFNYYEKNPVKGSEKQILELIEKEQPEVFCFQDYFISGSASLKDAEIKKALGGKYYSHVKLIGISGNRYYGIGTYTKYPIIKKSDIVHPKSSSLTIYTDILIKNDTFRIYNNHLQSYGLKRMERSFLEELYSSADNQAINDLLDVSTSLRNGFIKRSQQSQAVKDHINKSPYPVIVVGDFNDTPVSYSYRKIRKGLNDAFVKAGNGAGFTYRGPYPPNRIDYILYDNSLECSSFDIIKVKYSDHYPIIGYFRKTAKKGAS
jgi:endonuclease/exonuclease/phosphatase family metal-dependent hydrolase